MKQKIVIIGAGPAGLSAAYRILEKDQAGQFDVIVIEAEKKIGGISKTINYKGNRMDLGGHRFFTKETEVENFWRSLAKMPRRERISRIYFDNQFFDYPPQVNTKTIRKMGLKKTIKVGFSYLKSVFIKKPETSLENFYINRFGKQLYSMFFENYTEKLWGVHPSQISADWGAQRVKGLSIAKVIQNLLSPKSKKETSLIEEFEYPNYGPGELYEKLASKVRKLGGKIITEALVDKLIMKDGKVNSVSYVKAGKRKTIKTDELISSMPIKDLIESISRGKSTKIPIKVQKVAESLPYRDFRTIGILIKKTNKKLKDTWIYVQEPEIKMGRIQVFNNWSSKMVKNQKTVWLGLEYFCNEGDALWQMSDKEFFELASKELIKMGFVEKKDILDYHSEKVKKAYPAYFGSYKDFPVIQNFLDQIPNLYLVGRNGQHRYNNMDHSIMTGFIAADNIISGKEDKSNLWAVNTEKEYHEEISGVNPKNWFKRNLKYLIPFSIYLIISLTAICFHEIWEDEAQAWLIARDSTIPELIGRMQIEGHFLPWYLILMPFAKLGFSISPTINIISWLFTATSAWLMLKKLPCKFYIRVLFIFTLPMLYFYPANARCYCLIPLATILLIMFYKNRFAKPLPYLLSMLLMLNTHIFCLGFVAVLAFEYLFDWLKLRKKLDKKQNQKICLCILGVLILAGLSVLPLLGSVGKESASGVSLRLYEGFSINTLTRLIHHIIGTAFWFIPIELTVPLVIVFFILLALYEEKVFAKVVLSIAWQLFIALYIYSLVLPTRSVIPYFIILFFMVCRQWRTKQNAYAYTIKKFKFFLWIEIVIVGYLIFKVVKTGLTIHSVACFATILIFSIPFVIMIFSRVDKRLAKKLQKTIYKNNSLGFTEQLCILSKWIDLGILRLSSVLMLIVGCIAGLYTVYMEITEPFSEASEAASFINNKLEDTSLILVNGPTESLNSAAVVVDVVGNRKFYDLLNKSYFTYGNLKNDLEEDYNLCSHLTDFKNYAGSIYYMAPYSAYQSDLLEMYGTGCEKAFSEIYSSKEANEGNIFHATYEYFKIYKLDTNKL